MVKGDILCHLKCRSVSPNKTVSETAVTIFRRGFPEYPDKALIYMPYIREKHILPNQ